MRQGSGCKTLWREEIRTVVKDEKSQWRRVTRGMPQSSELVHIMFLVCVNDMPGHINSYINMLAYYAEILRGIRIEEDCHVTK